MTKKLVDRDTAHIAEFVHIIRFDERTQEFVLGGHDRVSVNQVGAMLSRALIAGETEVMLLCKHRSFSCEVSYRVDVNITYINQMLAFVAKHGWFWDELPDSNHRRVSDHAFDRANITPGLYWAQAQRLLASAQALDEFVAKHDWLKNPQTEDLSLGLGQDVRTISYLERDAANALLKAGLPDYRALARSKRNRLNRIRKAHRKAMGT